MAPIANPRVVFEKIPTEYPIPGETTRLDKTPTIDLDAPLNNGEFLVKNLVISVDPFLRGRMRDPSIKSYVPAFKLGAPIHGFGVGVVIKSRNPGAKVGDHLYFPRQDWELYTIRNTLESIYVIPEELKSLGLPWSQYLGICGMPGQTAYFGWKYAEAKKGDTIFITTAAGAVGSLVVQIAKAEGLKVIASAGSDDKVQFVKELGADVAFNYKKTSTAEVLQEHGPINIYWDHVGGEILETAIDNAAEHARILLVGAITEYNRQERFGIRNIIKVMNFRHVVRGVFVGDDMDRLPEFYRAIPPRVAKGELKMKEHLYNGLENAETAFLDLLHGRNTGKVVVVLGEDN